MSERGGKRKRETTTRSENEGKLRRSKRGKKEQEETVQDVDNGKKEQEGKEKEDEERVAMMVVEKSESGNGNEDRSEKKRKEEKENSFEDVGFRCGVCLEIMCWEREPRILPCYHSFCSRCLQKLFVSSLSSSSSSSPSSSSSSPPSSSSSSSSSFSSPSSSSPSSPSTSPSTTTTTTTTTTRRSSDGGWKCPICGERIECESVDSLESNFLIPETIDVLLSSKILFPSSNQQDEECFNFEICGERTQMFCSKCEMFICDVCNSSHISNLFTRNHKREQHHLQNADLKGGLDVLKKKQCSKHNSQVVSGFCFVCCEFVCVCCLLEKHDEHKKEVRSLEEGVCKKREEVVKIGVQLKNRLKRIEERKEKVEKEIKNLEKELEMKRVEKKEIELEKEDLRMRQDTIIRLSNTLPDISLFEEHLFSSLLETANDIVNESSLSFSTKREKGVICGDGLCFVSSFQSDKQPHGVSVNCDGNFLICENYLLRVRDREWNVIESVEKAINSQKLDPVDVSIGLNDEIVILDWTESKVVVLNKEGEFIRSFGSKGSQFGQFNRPRGLVVDGEGRIIVADTWNHRIQVFNNDGSFIRSFGSEGSSEGQFNKPFSVGVDRRDGLLVISDCWNDRIQVMDIEGNLIRCFGTQGKGDSQFETPEGVDVDGEGRIVVCDYGNGRVSVFKKDGTFLFSFGKDHMEKPSRVVVDSFGSILVSELTKRSLHLWKPKI